MDSPTDNELENPRAASAAPTGAPMIRITTTAALDHLLTHELMSAEACRGATALFEHLPVAATLREVMDGHHLRAGLLSEAIRAHDGQPSVDPSLHEAPVGKPQSADARAVLVQLLDLEQRGVAGYRQALHHLDDLTRVQIEAELLPAQERAFARVASAQLPSPDGAV